MSEILTIINQKCTRTVNKWLHYLPIYEKYFDAIRRQAKASGTKVRFLEIGIQNGGSGQIWKEYFGADHIEYYGLDIDPRCLQLRDELGTIFIGNQADRNFMAQLSSQLPEIDILLDDGGHAMDQQLVTFEVLWPKIAPGGIYFCEDTHSSYFPELGGKDANLMPYAPFHNFMDRVKSLMDQINGYHRGAVKSTFTEECAGMHIHDSIVVLDKAPTKITPPVNQLFIKESIIKWW